MKRAAEGLPGNDPACERARQAIPHGRELLTDAEARASLAAEDAETGWIVRDRQTAATIAAPADHRFPGDRQRAIRALAEARRYCDAGDAERHALSCAVAREVGRRQRHGHAAHIAYRTARKAARDALRVARPDRDRPVSAAPTELAAAQAALNAVEEQRDAAVRATAAQLGVTGSLPAETWAPPPGGVRLLRAQRAGMRDTTEDA